MIKKRGAYHSSHLMLVGIILVILLVLLLIILPPEYKYSNYNKIFKQKFIKDDFNVIDGSEIKFLNVGIEVEDFLLINGGEYKIDKEKIEGILIRKESTNKGTKIIYGLRNEGNDKEIQFVWKSNIPKLYDRANNFDLNKDFVTDSEIIKFYSDGTYESYMTFKDVGKAFGGVSLSYNANTRTLIASSNKIRLKKNREIVMDPGFAYPTPDDGAITGNTIVMDHGVETDITAPQIKFAYPTPDNGTITSNTNAEINISMEERNLDSFIWNWNGINYTFYDDSLILMMNFDDNVEDHSKYKNDGVIYGPTYTEGKYGKALSFNEGYVNVDDNTGLDVFSTEFWFKPGEDYDLASNYVSFIYGDNYEIYMEKGNIIFEYDGNKLSSSTNKWNKDQWYHILVTYDGVQKIYVNGLKENSAIVSSPFAIRNNAGENVAFFLNSGDIVLKGICSAGICPYPGDDAFVIHDSFGETAAYINSAGNLCVEDSDCNDDDANCNNPGDGSFIIQDTDSRIVSYINSNGNLCLIGNLIENGIS